MTSKSYIAKKINSIIDDAIYFIWIYIVIALPPLAILYFSSGSSVTTIDFPTLVAISIILPAIGSALSVWRKIIPPLFYWHLDRQSKLHTATVALFFSIVLWWFFSFLSFLSYFGFVILFLFFLLYIPLSTSFLSSIDFNKLWVFIISKKQVSKFYIVKRVCYMLVALLLLHTLIIVLDGQIRIYNHHQMYLSRHPQVYNIKPQIVYYDNKIVLTGRGFGWKGRIDTDTKFKYQDGVINISLWTDTKVIFTVPLHWKTGDITIWIQKNTDWDGKKVVLNSNEVKLRLISRDDGWDKDDDAYFEQLKRLDKETLRINGYK